MIRIKPGVDILKTLASQGFTSYKLRQYGLIGQAEMQKIRQGGLPSWKTLDLFCRMTRFQVGEIIEYVDDENEQSP